MKYANIFIIMNLDECIIPQGLLNFLGFESPYKKDTIIIEFEDNTVCDINEIQKQHTFTFGKYNFNSIYPIFIGLSDSKKTLFYKEPFDLNGLKKLKFDIFDSYKNFINYKKVSSIYNAIYYEEETKDEVFAIVRVKSSEEKPRFVIAYDENIFNKTNISTLVHYIFKDNLKD